MPKIIEVPSTSNPRIKYRIDVDGWRCSCPAWRFNKGERRDCKHLIALKEGREMRGARVVDLAPADVLKTWPIVAPKLDL